MTGYEDGRTGFSIVTPNGLHVDYRVFALFALPGESMSLESSERLQAASGHGPRVHANGTTLEWTAPSEPGHYVINLQSRASGNMRLNLFVLHPADEIEGDAINHYRIGAYPAEPYLGLEAYRPPEGFVEVTPEMTELELSPHFTLGQFLCKQEADWPRFAYVQERLVIKLERLLEAVNDAGIATSSFTVMSGYRTPHYNESIGNSENSRHVYGGAADIFIDVAPQDGVMDDLNGDGALDEGDAAWLYDFIDRVSAQPEWDDLSGGLGQYPSTPAHGPFVHVDERGWPARWGG